VLYVPAHDYSVETERSIVERLKGRMGSIEVTMDRVDKIPRAANGKFQAVICALPKKELMMSEKAMES
jgi:hypothetical protein